MSIYIYIYICVCVCVCEYASIGLKYVMFDGIHTKRTYLLIPAIAASLQFDILRPTKMAVIFQKTFSNDFLNKNG